MDSVKLVKTKMQQNKLKQVAGPNNQSNEMLKEYMNYPFPGQYEVSEGDYTSSNGDFEADLQHTNKSMTEMSENEYYQDGQEAQVVDDDDEYEDIIDPNDP